MLRAGGVAVLAAALALCAGCFHTLGSTRTGPGHQPTIESMHKLVRIGITTPADVEAALGPPTRTLTPASDRQVLVYDYPSALEPGATMRYTYTFAKGILKDYEIDRVPRGIPAP
jgi:hypothetical protein